MFSESHFIQALAAIVGNTGVLTGASAVPHFNDWRNRYQGHAIAVAFPHDTQQVSEVIKLCSVNQVAVVPQGGNSSLSGASVPLAAGRQLVVNLSRMNKVLNADPANQTLTVQAGCTLATVRATAEYYNSLFPLGLTAIAEQCEIGGNIATNAGGISVLRYGSMRDMVLGLEVVLPDGRIWDGLRGLRKDNTGYDMKQIFIGSEGTLGIVTAAVLKLFPLPKTTVTAIIGLGTVTSAAHTMNLVRENCGGSLSAFEIMSRSCLEMVFKHIPGTQEPFDAAYPWYLLIQLADMSGNQLLDTLRSTITGFTASRFDFQITADAAVAERWWLLRRNISEAQKREGYSIKHDIAVPISKLSQLILHASASLKNAYPNVRVLVFGHMGDGNLHYNVSLADTPSNHDFIVGQERNVNKLVYDVVHQLGGSISAEHGVGQLKRDAIRVYKNRTEIDMMRTLKRAFDPQGLMNPGKVI